MSYTEQRKKLEKDGAEWFDTLRKLKALTKSIVLNETLDELELTDMRDNIRIFFALTEHELQKFKNKKSKESQNDTFNE